MSDVRWGDAKVTRLGIMLRVFVYEIDGLLIDTGAKSGLNQLKPFFKKIENEVEQIALTHMHEDHSGNAFWWWNRKKLPIYLHSKSVPLANKNGKYPFYRRLFWGPRRPFEAKPIPKLIETPNYTFQVIDTPGHSDDSISLYDEKSGILFSGDLYITRKPKLFLREESIPKTIDSLKRLISLDVQTIYCAHSGKIENGKEKLQGKLDYLLGLQDTILELHQKGKNKKEIISKLFPQTSPMIFLSSNEFSYERAVDSIVNND